MKNNMNILMLNYEYPPLGGGGASVCRDISEKLVKEGNHVTVVTMNMSGLQARENVNGVEIQRVKCWRKKAKVCHPWEQMTYCLSAYRHINKNIDLRNFDVVHCHFIIPTGLLALWLKKKYKKEYILTAQGSDVIGHNNKRFGWLYKVVRPTWIKIVNNARTLTAPSDYLIKKIHDTVPDKKCELIQNGLYIANYTSAEKTKSIVTLSRLQESKGIQDLLIAIADIDLNGWKVYVLGEGPYRIELEKMILELGLKDKVSLLGFVSDADREKYLSEAGLYFTGSWFEAMPISVLEAMASSCNIIASDIEPHRAVLSQEHIYKSREDLKKLLSETCKNKPKEACYDMEQYDWNNIVERYITIYK